MKKTLCILLALALCLFGAAVAETAAIATTVIAHPTATPSNFNIFTTENLTP